MAEVFTFEDGGAGWTIPPAYSVVRGEGRNGSSAFVYENADPALPYVYPQCEVQLQTGVVYRVSGWIRTENLEPGKRKGAQLAVLCWDAQGELVKDWYSPGVRGTTDWQKIEFVTREIPPEAAKCALLAYCTPQALGKACFDDILVAPYEDPAVGMFFSSAYRNTAASGKVTFGVALSLPEQYSPKETKGVFSYTGSDGVRKKVSVTPAARDRVFFPLDAAQLKEGESKIGFELFAPDGKSLGTSSLPFHRPAKMPNRRVWIDEHHRAIVDGEPFFPLGMYSSVRMRRDDYVKGPFNTIASYLPLDAVEMDFFHTNGVKVIYSVKDMHPAMPERTPSTVTDEATASAYVHAVVDTLRTHPALLAWYVNDEAPVTEVPERTHLYSLFRRIDPNHPTWAVLDRLHDLREFIPTYDVLGMDPYPVAQKPLTHITEFIRGTQKAIFNDRPLWNVPQTFNWGWYRKHLADKERFPTEQEMKNMNWQHIALGANGLISYCYHALYRDVKPENFDNYWKPICNAAAEVKKMMPVLLSVEEAPAAQGAPEMVPVRTWMKDGELYVLAVNARNEVQTANLALSRGAWAVAGCEIGVAGRLSAPDRLIIELPPLGVSFMRLRAVR
jgi:hypothetical protein